MLGYQTVAFLGAGSMTEAMIAGIVNSRKMSGSQIIITNRSNRERLEELEVKYAVKVSRREELDFSHIDILILAMKPKDVQEALQFIKGKLQPHQLVCSVLAGIPIPYIERELQEGQQVIRVMPNTSGMIGESATAICAGQYASAEAVAAARELLGCIGSVYFIEEEQMDIFTGIAGSGPAYFYYLMEYIEKAGTDGGLDCEIVRSIGAQTLLGAAKMLMQQDESPAELREKVTSQNGTTAAGLEALDKRGGGEAIFQAIRAAAKRSKGMCF